MHQLPPNGLSAQQNLMAALNLAQRGQAPRSPQILPGGQFGPMIPPPAQLPSPGMPAVHPQPQAQMAPPVRVPISRSAPMGYREWPGFSECMRALQAALERTLTTGDLAPHIHAPFKSRSICLQQRAVINVPAAFDAAANAGGIALAAAESVFQAVLLLTPTNVAPPFDSQLVIQYETPPGHVAVFKSWGITVANSRPEAADVFATVDGSPNTGSTSPDPLISGATQELHQPTMLIVPDNKRLQIRVRNLDVGSAILVTLSLCGWQLPVRLYRDSLKSLLPKPGYGVDCEED